MAALALRERVMRLARKAEASPLEGDLKRATEANSLEVPDDAVAAVAKASHSCEEDRRAIMLHIHRCLSDTASASWRKVHAALVLLEALLRDGSPEVVAESARGVHFDLSQRLGFLEKYEYGTDQRVQSLLRKKASTIRAAWLEKQMALVEGLCESEEKEAEPVINKEPTEEYRLARLPPAPVKEMDLLFDESTTTDGESSSCAGMSDPSPTVSTTSPGAGSSPGGDLLSGFTAQPAPPPPPASLAPAADALDLFGEAVPSPAAAVPPPPPPAPAAPAAPAADTDWLKLAESHGLVNSPRGGAPPAADLLAMDDIPAPAPARVEATAAPAEAPAPAPAPAPACGGWGKFMDESAGGVSTTSAAAAADSSLLDLF